MKETDTRKSANKAMLIGAVLVIAAVAMMLVAPHIQIGQEPLPTVETTPIQRTEPATETTVPDTPATFTVHEGAFHGDPEAFWNGKDWYRLTLVRSVNELAELNGGTIPDSESRYDAAYFAEKSLIVYDYIVSQASTKVVYDSHTDIRNGNVYVYVRYYHHPDAADTIYGYGSLIVEPDLLFYPGTEAKYIRKDLYPTLEEYEAMLDALGQMATEPTETEPIVTEPPETEATYPTEADENDIAISGTSEDDLPILTGIDSNHSSGGFFWDKDGSTVISILNGTPEFLDITTETVTIDHDGQAVEATFKWCAHAGEIGCYRLSNCWFRTIAGNDQYITITVLIGEPNQYTYLYDVQNKEIIDPLGKAETSTWGEINSISFSPSGQGALVYCETGAKYLNIVTGECQDVQKMTGCEDGLSVSFVTDELLAFEYVEGAEDEYYSDCFIYNLTDGSAKTIYTGERYGWLYDMGGLESFGRFHAHYHGNGLCIIDCVTGEHHQTEIHNYSWINVSSDDTLVIETYYGPVYLFTIEDGAVPVFTEE